MADDPNFILIKDERLADRVFRKVLATVNELYKAYMLTVQTGTKDDQTQALQKMHQYWLDHDLDPGDWNMPLKPDGAEESGQ